jgi:hypothetical protein
VKEKDAKELVEKRTVMNLLAAFPLAAKHFLRDEYAHDYPEVQAYLTAFPENFTKPTSEEIKKLMGSPKERAKVNVPDFTAPSNTPSEITYYLGAYLDTILERRTVSSDVMYQMQVGKF